MMMKKKKSTMTMTSHPSEAKWSSSYRPNSGKCNPQSVMMVVVVVVMVQTTQSHRRTSSQAFPPKQIAHLIHNQ
jgi:hypothetical protein